MIRFCLQNNFILCWWIAGMHDGRRAVLVVVSGFIWFIVVLCDLSVTCLTKLPVTCLKMMKWFIACWGADCDRVRILRVLCYYLMMQDDILTKEEIQFAVYAANLKADECYQSKIFKLIVFKFTFSVEHWMWLHESSYYFASSSSYVSHILYLFHLNLNIAYSFIYCKFIEISLNSSVYHVM